MARARTAPPRQRKPSPPVRRRNPAPLIALGVAWAIVLLLWAGGVVRAGGSVVFALAIAGAAVYVGTSAVDMARRRDPLRAARRAVLLLLAVLVPVAFNPKSFDPFNPLKYWILATGAIVVAALWAVEWAGKGRPPRWRNGLHWPVLALLTWTVVATFASSNVRVSVLGFYGSYDGLYAALALGFLFFAVVEAFSLRDLKPLLSVVYFAGGGLVALYGLVQLHDVSFGGGRWDWVEWGEASFKGSTIWATLGNPNHLAGFMAVLLPIGLVLLFLHRSWWVRALIGAIALVGLLEMLQTTTRGAWLAALATLVVVGLLLVPEIKARPLVALGVAGALAAGLLGAGVVLASTRNLRSQLGSIFDFGGNSTAVQRIELWKSATGMAVDRPLVGYGPDTFRLPFASYQTEKFVGLYGPDQQANGPHNVFMNHLASAGFPGLLAFVSLVGFGALRGIGAWRRLRRRERDGAGDDRAELRSARLVLTGIVGALVAYLAQGLFNTQKIPLSFLFWILLGALAVVALASGVPDTLDPRRLLSSEPAEPAEPERAPAPAGRGGRTSRSRRRRGLSPAAAGSIAIALVAAGALSWLVSGPMRADQHFRTALLNVGNFRGDRPVDPAFAPRVRRAREEYLKAVASNPWEAQYLDAFARMNVNLAKSLSPEASNPNVARQAVSFLEEARALRERVIHLLPNSPHYLRSYAETLVAIHQLDPERDTLPEAARALLGATRANPFQPTYAVQLVSVLNDVGRTEEALREAERALRAFPVRDDLLRWAAQLSEKAGRPDRARELWGRLLALYPEDPEAKKALGRA